MTPTLDDQNRIGTRSGIQVIMTNRFSVASLIGMVTMAVPTSRITSSTRPLKATATNNAAYSGGLYAAVYAQLAIEADGVTPTPFGGTIAEYQTYRRPDARPHAVPK